MKKNMYLGRSKSGLCCLLYSLLSFNQLKEHVSELEASDFVHDATDWNGCDDEERTLRIEQIRKSGNSVTLPHPISFYGKDFDMGFTYSWRFDVAEIIEVTHESEGEL